jgi:hypothetical protein
VGFQDASKRSSIMNRQLPRRGPAGLLDRLPAAAPGRRAHILWAVALAALVIGIGGWALGSVVTGVVALWALMVAAVALGLVLPLPLALVSPLFMGMLGWLVDMLPLVILTGWTAVVVRWGVGVLRDRRLPQGGAWVWLLAGLFAWTALGVLVIQPGDLRHFTLLVGIQGVMSGVLLAVIDELRTAERRAQVVAGLSAFVVFLSAAVVLQWAGVPVQELQNIEPRQRVEAAYGINIFPNAVGMIRHARSAKAGARQLRNELDKLSTRVAALPGYEVYRPKFRAFEGELVVRFEGSARSVEHELEPLRVQLLYDNIGIAPANTVPRMRSFPRNSLTYAGVCAALFPLTLYLAWTGRGRRRWLGWTAAGACLFGAGFSLARGSWVAILIGVMYLAVFGRISRRRKLQVAGLYLTGALVLTGVYLIRYEVDPVNARAGGAASVTTREELYEETLSLLSGRHALLGYGTTRPRLETGETREHGRYVPRAGTHSTYLNYLFRTGIPGGLAIAAIYALAWLCARGAEKTSNGSERVFRSLAAAAVVIAASHAVILNLWTEPTYTLTVSLLLGLAAAGATNLPGSILPWKQKGPAEAPAS